MPTHDMQPSVFDTVVKITYIRTEIGYYCVSIYYPEVLIYTDEHSCINQNSMV